MKRSNIGFPYPVLCSDNNDYGHASFVIDNTIEPYIENNKIGIQIEYKLKSDGLQGMIDNAQANVVIYLESPNSSFRTIYTFPAGETVHTWTIDAVKLSKMLKIKGVIVSKCDFDMFCFDEHNKELFGNMAFKVHKGDILAISNLFEVELSQIDPLENKPSIFSIRPDDETTQAVRVDIYGDTNRINIWLKRELHNEYQELREEPRIRKLLASYYVLPALVEALEFMRNDTTGEDDDIRTGAWYQSLENRLSAMGIVLNDEISMTSVANRVLMDIIQASMDDFKFIKDNLAGGN